MSKRTKISGSFVILRGRRLRGRQYRSDDLIIGRVGRAEGFDTITGKGYEASVGNEIIRAARMDELRIEVERAVVERGW